MLHVAMRNFSPSSVKNFSCEKITCNIRNGYNMMHSRQKISGNLICLKAPGSHFTVFVRRENISKKIYICGNKASVSGVFILNIVCRIKFGINYYKILGDKSNGDTPVLRQKIRTNINSRKR